MSGDALHRGPTCRYMPLVGDAIPPVETNIYKRSDVILPTSHSGRAVFPEITCVPPEPWDILKVPWVP